MIYAGSLVSRLFDITVAWIDMIVFSSWFWDRSGDYHKALHVWRSQGAYPFSSYSEVYVFKVAPTVCEQCDKSEAVELYMLLQHGNAAFLFC